MDARKQWIEIRNKCRVSMQTISDISGVSKSMIYKYEKGESEISVKNLEKMLDVLDYKIKIDNEHN